MPYKYLHWINRVVKYTIPSTKPSSMGQPHPKYKATFNGATTPQVQSHLQWGNHTPSTKPPSMGQPHPKYKAIFNGATTPQVQSHLQWGNHTPSTKPPSMGQPHPKYKATFKRATTTCNLQAVLGVWSSNYRALVQSSGCTWGVVV